MTVDPEFANHNSVIGKHSSVFVQLLLNHEYIENITINKT
jgi:hypothetical protein